MGEKTAVSRWLFLSIHEWTLARIYAYSLSNYPVQLSISGNLIDYQTAVGVFEVAFSMYIIAYFSEVQCLTSNETLTALNNSGPRSIQ